MTLAFSQQPKSNPLSTGLSGVRDRALLLADYIGGLRGGRPHLPKGELLSRKATQVAKVNNSVGRAIAPHRCPITYSGDRNWTPWAGATGKKAAGLPSKTDGKQIAKG